MPKYFKSVLKPDFWNQDAFLIAIAFLRSKDIEKIGIGGASTTGIILAFASNFRVVATIDRARPSLLKRIRDSRLD